MSDDLTRGTVSGLQWTYGAVAASTLLQVGYTAAMARLLTPADFGLVAMAALFLRFGDYFAQMGVGQALVQKPKLSESDIRAGFMSSIGLGIFFAFLIVAAAPLGSRLFATEEVVPLISVLALSMVLRGFGVTAQSLLRRELRFRSLALTDVLSHGIGYMAVGLGSALAGAGVWSLVAAGLGQAALGSVLAYAFVRHPVAPRFSLRNLGPLYSFGGRVSVSNFLEFAGKTLDTVFISRYAGPSPMGQYNRAQLLINLPLENLTIAMTKVLFPALSRIQSDVARLRRTYLSVIRFVSVVILPTAAGMAVAAPTVVGVFLGPQWGTAATVLPVLAVTATANYLSVLAAVTCEATNTLNKKLLLQVGHLGVVASLLSFSIGRPLVVYALAVAVAAVLRFAGYLVIMRQALKLPIVEQAGALAPVFLVASMVAAAVYGVALGGSIVGAQDPFILAGQILIGAVVLLLALLWGPLAAVRQDAYHRLLAAGLVGPERGLVARAIDRLLRYGRHARL